MCRSCSEARAQNPLPRQLEPGPQLEGPTQAVQRRRGLSRSAHARRRYKEVCRVKTRAGALTVRKHKSRSGPKRRSTRNVKTKLIEIQAKACRGLLTKERGSRALKTSSWVLCTFPEHNLRNSMAKASKPPEVPASTKGRGPRMNQSCREQDEHVKHLEAKQPQL